MRRLSSSLAALLSLVLAVQPAFALKAAPNAAPPAAATGVAAGPFQALPSFLDGLPSNPTNLIPALQKLRGISPASLALLLHQARAPLTALRCKQTTISIFSES